jgi:uncharacterized protein
MAICKKDRLLIFGSSVRAAAQSASAAGFEVIAADLFADRDLREVCPEARPVKYPMGLIEFARSIEPSLWMYTGALENHPQIIEEISNRHELLGNRAEVLRCVRDPIKLAAFAEENGFRFPQLRGDRPSMGKRWLIKRLASGGGVGIRMASTSARLKPGEMFQEFVEGIAGSATILGDGHSARYLFATEQLINAPFLGAPRFHFAGNITSNSASRDLGIPDAQLTHLGEALVSEYGLRGLFGVDFVVNEDGIWLLEVNPRYTASMELFELSSGAPLIEQHANACSQNAGPRTLPRSALSTAARGNNEAYRAKGIFHAQARCRITGRLSNELWALRDEIDLADLPMGGITIAKGCPVLTIFAEGNSREEMMKSLEEKANQLRALGIP